MPIPLETFPPLALGAWLRYDVVAGLMPDPPARVLEVGCGQGSFGARLARHYDYVGVEPDEASFRRASERIADVGRGKVLHGLAEQLDPDERFDVVCAFEVLEHVEDDRGALDAWTAFLRPGGTLLLSTPAHQRRFGPSDELVGHVRRYDPDRMRLLLRDAGLHDVDVTCYGMPLGYALEEARNVLAKRKLSDSQPHSGHVVAERTAASGRYLQPQKPWTAWAGRVGTWPFRRIQGLTPATGMALVARGRRPE